jgi:hypothetical protein
VKTIRFDGTSSAMSNTGPAVLRTVSIEDRLDVAAVEVGAADAVGRAGLAPVHLADRVVDRERGGAGEVAQDGPDAGPVEVAPLDAVGLKVRPVKLIPQRGRAVG